MPLLYNKSIGENKHTYLKDSFEKSAPKNKCGFKMTQ